MGANDSKVITTTENNTNIVNKNVMNVLNKNVFSAANESILKILNEAAVIVNQSNAIKISGKFNGDLNIDLTQNNYAKVTFTSEIISTLVNEVNTSIVSTLMNDMLNNIDNSVLDNLSSTATANIKNGWANVNFGNKNESVNTSLNNVGVNNSTETNLQNIVEASVSNSIVTDKVNSCISSLNQTNEFILGPVSDVKTGVTEGVSVSGNATLNLSQNNNINIVTKCIISDSSVSEITNNIASITGVKIVDEVTTDTKQTTASTTDLTSENQGVGGAVSDAVEGVGSGISSIVGSISDGISDLFSGTSGMYSFGISSIISCVVCVVLIIAVIGIAFIMTDEQGSKTVMGIAGNMPTSRLTRQLSSSNLSTSLPSLSIPQLSQNTSSIILPAVPSTSKPQIPSAKISPPTIDRTKKPQSQTGGDFYNLLQRIFKI